MCIDEVQTGTKSKKKESLRINITNILSSQPD